MFTEVKGLEIMSQVNLSAFDVFSAFIEPRLLNNWFCSSSNVEPRMGGSCQFSGPYIFPSGGSFEGEIMTFAPPEKFVFTWPMENYETRVNIILDEKGARETRLLMAHDNLPPELDLLHLEKAWTIYITNLRLLLEKNSMGLRYNYEKTPSPTCNIRINLYAHPEEVYEALLIPEKLDRWVTTSAQVDPIAGGIYSWGWAKYGPVSISNLEKNLQLVLNWQHAKEKSIVSFSLSPRKDYTQIVLNHLGLLPEQLPFYSQKWTAHLNLLKTYLETGNAYTHTTHI